MGKMARLNKIEIVDTQLKNIIQIGMLTNWAEITLDKSEDILYGINLNMRINRGVKIIIPKTTVNERAKPAVKIWIGEISKIIIAERLTDVSPSYLRPRLLHSIRVMHIMVARSEDDEKPHTPE